MSFVDKILPLVALMIGFFLNLLYRKIQNKDEDKKKMNLALYRLLEVYDKFTKLKDNMIRAFKIGKEDCIIIEKNRNYMNELTTKKLTDNKIDDIAEIDPIAACIIKGIIDSSNIYYGVDTENININPKKYYKDMLRTEQAIDTSLKTIEVAVEKLESKYKVGVGYSKVLNLAMEKVEVKSIFEYFPDDMKELYGVKKEKDKN